MIKSRRMRWAGHVARMGKKRNVYRILVRKPEGKRPLGRPRRKHNRSEMVAVQGLNEALLYHIHTYKTKT
jgi:hypothetical protein